MSITPASKRKNKVELSPDDAVRAIKELTNALERIGRISKLAIAMTLITTGLVIALITTTFVVTVRTHSVQNEALRIVLERMK